MLHSCAETSVTSLSCIIESLRYVSTLQLMPLVLTESEGKSAVNASYFASINPEDGKCLQEKYSDRFSDCDFGLLANLYACEGKPGKVRKV